MQLDTLGCPDALEYSFIEFLGCLFAEVLGPNTTGIYNVHNVMTGSHIYLGLFCQVRWSSDTQSPGEGCTIIAKNNSSIRYCLHMGCMHVLSTFYKSVVHSHINILQCLFCFLVLIRSVGLLLDFPQISNSIL